MQVKLVGGENVELKEGQTAKDLADSLNLKGPDQALGVNINGKNCDLSHPLQDGDLVQYWSFSDPEGKEIFWHTSAHVLAQAVLRLFPNAKPTIGPPIQTGFYYDFADLEITEEDLDRIENEMKKVVSENLVSQREEFSNKKDAIKAFKNNPYKKELIEEIPEEEGLSGYRQGEFFDLCRGPHLYNLGKIKAIKIMKTAGAYWRGDSEREMLTRIYGVTFPDRKQLKEYLHQLEEARKRDHKILGPRLDLFSLHEEAPGMPLIHPKGMIVWNALLDYWREVHEKDNYVEIKTPVMMSRELWEKSGHWAYYRQNMFTSSIEEREYAIKPMNCPGGLVFYNTRVHSYRELPYKVAEIGNVHRYEPSGAVSGLFRVRCFHQDDAHIFMTPDQIEQEIVGVLHLTEEIYTTFGLEYHLELSTRPEKDTIGSDEDWEMTTAGLKAALDHTGLEYRINEGDGAFYGPKIDMHIRDALGRTWQCGTIQLDMALPQKFDLEYAAADGSRKQPVMIHRAIYGSVERFLGILIEHFAGRFPLWLSPCQVRILTVADRHIPYAEKLNRKIRDSGFHCDVDTTAESVGKKVRNAQLAQYNYILTVGDREMEDGTVSLRTRDNVVHGAIVLDEFLEKISREKQNRSLQSPFQAPSA